MNNLKLFGLIDMIIKIYQYLTNRGTCEKKTDEQSAIEKDFQKNFWFS